MKVDNSEFQNLNAKTYRDKLFEIAKNKKTEDISRREIYAIIELIDAKIDLQQEDNRY